MEPKSVGAKGSQAVTHPLGWQDGQMTRSVYYDAFGGPDSLIVGDVEPMPTGPDCVRLEVAGAGINPVDYKVGYGYLAGAIETFFPLVTGWDVAGTVTAVGPAVVDFAVGDRVFGYARMDVVKHGTAAEEVVLPERLLAGAPAAVDLVTAAAVPLTGLTALQLVRRLDVVAGETVLVHNAAGGVGQFAVQLARIAGARVIGTASARNHDHLRSLGVEPVVYGDTLPEQVRGLAPKGADVVVDLIGGGALEQSDPLLADGGRVGSIADGAGALSRGGDYVFVHPSSADLAELARLIDAGLVLVDVAGTYPFAQAASAYAELEGGHVRGKIVLVP